MKSPSEYWAYDNPCWGEGDDSIANQIVLMDEEEILKLEKDLWYQRKGDAPPPSDRELIDQYIVLNWCWKVKLVHG